MNPVRCPGCGVEHDELEPGFRRPDAFLVIPKGQRASRARESDDLVVIDGAAFFVRGVARIPVLGRPEPYGWGFWARISEEAFDDCLRYYDVDPPEDHPGFPGTVANQSHLLRPTLGLPVHLTLDGGRARPRLTLLDADHPLVECQRAGATLEQVALWSARAQHAQEPEPAAPHFVPTLGEHGWCLAPLSSLDRAPYAFQSPPKPGDCVKAAFRFLAADEHGEQVTRVEFMWVLLDLVEPRGWSGTLANAPTVPGPIAFGSRVWLAPAEVMAHQSVQ